MTTPHILRYPARVSLLACPFCREMYARGEAKVCRHCGVELERLEDLPPSLEVQAETPPIAPELVTRPFSDLSRGRGALIAISVLGLVAFFLPWYEVRSPDTFVLTGFAMATRKLFLVWAAPVAWFVLLPVVLTRRSIYKMRGARVAVGFLGSFPGVTTLNLLLHPPRGIRVASGLTVHVETAVGAGLIATLVLSALAIALAFRFGGPLISEVASKGRGKNPGPVPPPPPSSAGHTLH